MRTFHPEIEPYEHGMLDVGDGQSVYWELCGNPEGKSKGTDSHRRARYRIG